jgi:hypothetical protein
MINAIKPYYFDLSDFGITKAWLKQDKSMFFDKIIEANPYVKSLQDKKVELLPILQNKTVYTEILW